MPDMKSLFSDKQVEQLSRSSSSAAASPGLLRYAGQLYAKHVVLANQGFPRAVHAASRARTSRSWSADDDELEAAEGPARGGAEPLPDRPQLLALGRPAARDASRTSSAARRSSSTAASAATASSGDGKGPAARFLSPPPADFTDKDDACCGGDTGPGRLLLPDPARLAGTAMENFGDRLSVNDIWRVVLFVKTIPNGTLEPNRVPEPKDYIVWQPSTELLAWVEDRTRSSTDNASFDKKQVDRPVHAGGDARLPGPRAGRPHDAERQAHTPLSLDDGGRGDQGDLRGHARPRLGRRARARREAAARARRRTIPPTVPGQQ